MFENNKKNKWDQFAKQDVLFYIDTEAKNLNIFWQRGENNYQNYILKILNKYSVNKKLALDFGSGIGRHTFPMTKYFEKIYAIDISKNMLEKAKEIAKEKNISTIDFKQNKDFFSIDEKINFIYSADVFQHIEEMEEIEKIIRQFSNLLSGYAYLHFDTRKENFIYNLKNKLPDFILPKTQRQGIRRIRRDSERLRKFFKQNNFEIIEEQNPDSKYHFFILKK